MTYRQRRLAWHSFNRPARAACLLAVVLATACGADDIVSVGSGQHLTVGVGERFDVLLRAGGLGSYRAPPTISAPVIEFLEQTVVDESPVTPPGGPLQRFRFRATATGTAIITFTPTQIGPAAFDTVVVR